MIWVAKLFLTLLYIPVDNEGKEVVYAVSVSAPLPPPEHGQVSRAIHSNVLPCTAHWQATHVRKVQLTHRNKVEHSKNQKSTLFTQDYEGKNTILPSIRKIMRKQENTNLGVYKPRGLCAPIVYSYV